MILRFTFLISIVFSATNIGLAKNVIYNIQDKIFSVEIGEDYNEVVDEKDKTARVFENKIERKRIYVPNEFMKDGEVKGLDNAIFENKQCIELKLCLYMSVDNIEKINRENYISRRWTWHFSSRKTESFKHSFKHFYHLTIKGDYTLSLMFATQDNNDVIQQEFDEIVKSIKVIK